MIFIFHFSKYIPYFSDECWGWKSVLYCIWVGACCWQSLWEYVWPKDSRKNLCYCHTFSYLWHQRKWYGFNYFTCGACFCCFVVVTVRWTYSLLPLVPDNMVTFFMHTYIECIHVSYDVYSFCVITAWASFSKQALYYYVGSLWLWTVMHCLQFSWYDV